MTSARYHELLSAGPEIGGGDRERLSGFVPQMADMPFFVRFAVDPVFRREVLEGMRGA